MGLGWLPLNENHVSEPDNFLGPHADTVPNATLL